MAITKERKVKLLADLIEKLPKSKITILINYSGLNTEQFSQLREKLEKIDADLRVVKNNIIKLAFKKTKTAIDPEILTGPIALIFGFSEEIRPAKIIWEFSQIEKKPEILTGAIYQNEFTDSEIIKKLAKIPEINILKTQLVSNISAPISGLIFSLKANLSGIVSILNQYQQQKT